MKFVLKSVAQKVIPVAKKTKTEEAYTYESESAKLTFHAHPTKAWNWCMVHEESNDVGIALANKIIGAFCKNFDAETPKELNI